MIPEEYPMTASRTRTAKAGTSNHFIDNVRDALLRGGRLTKWKGKVASIAPLMGADLGETLVATADAVSSRLSTLTGRLSTRLASGASVAALSAALLVAPSVAPITLTGGAGQAMAGSCAPGANAGEWTCTGAADPATDMPQTPQSAPGGNLVVSTDSSFGITTAASDAITLTNAVGDGSITFTDNNTSVITGYYNGIFAFNYGTGVLSVTSTGAATGTGYFSNGIYASNDGTDLTIASADASGEAYGIRASNYGIGALSVTSTGTATGTSLYGIRARNDGTGTSLTIVSNDASGGYFGIGAINYGTGALSVTSNGTATGTNVNSSGIYAYNSSNGMGLTIVSNDASGEYYGIGARNYGTDLTIVSNDASGGFFGIGAINRGTGATSITVTGDVTGGTSYGIFTQTGAGGMTAITLDNGANVSSAAGLAIYNDAGASDTIVKTGAAVSGDIVLSEGSDNLTFAGGDFSGVTLFDGGDDLNTAVDTDILTFAGSSGALVGAKVTKWENLVIGTGSTISFSDGAVTVGDITDTLTGLAIQAGGTLNAVGGLALDAHLTNNGTVTTQDGVVGDIITVAGNYAGTGLLLLDANTATTTGDTLVINGDVISGGTTVRAQSTTPNALLSSDLVAVTVVGTSMEGDFVGALTSGAFDYSLVKAGNDFVFSVASKAVNSTGAVYEAAPSVLGAFNRLPTLEQRAGQRQWAGQSVARAEGQPITGAWVRFSGDKLDATTTTGSSIDSSTWGLQTGADFAVEPSDAGQWVLGVTGQYGQVSSTVTSALGFGTIDAEGFGVGATATWYGNTGTYVDLQGQINWIDSDIASSAAGSLTEGELSRAYALSAEVGHRFALNETSALVPQAQLTWGRVDGGSFTDSAGNAVDLGSNDRTIGRIGLAYEYTPDTATDGNQTKAYVIGNILHDFSGDSSVNVAGADLSTGAAETTWGEIGLGGSYAMDANTTLYGEAAYRASFDGSSANNGLSGTVGLRIQW
jgi:outer membrane autotransporter protein